MSSTSICQWQGCRNTATHQLVLQIRSGLLAPPSDVPLDYVCPQHSKVQWHQVVTPEMWRRFQLIAATLGKPVPDRLYSTIRRANRSQSA